MNNMTGVYEIKKSLSKIHPFSEEQLGLFTDKLIYRSLKKKDFLLKEDQLSDRIAFILTGSFRFFKKKNHGELTIKFFVENNWIADLESLLAQQPSKNYIEAIEDSEIASITLRDIHMLMDAHPCFRMLNALMADLTISTSYIATINSKSPLLSRIANARQGNQDLATSNPLSENFSHIAWYLQLNFVHWEIL